MLLFVEVVNLYSNIKMDIVVFYILKLIFISMASSQSGTPNHVCEYAGDSFFSLTGYQFKISDVPQRCELITYGMYYFDKNDQPIVKDDEDAIKSLVAASKSVYTYVGYTDVNASWSDMLDCSDQATFDQLVNPFISKMKELNITGVIINIIDIYDDKPDKANKISAYVAKLKAQMPGIKFGLNVMPFYDGAYTKIPQKELFDFTITNSVIDLYFIDSQFNDYKCTPELAKSGTLITSPDENVRSLELLSNAISQSTMDKTKTILCINIFPLSPDSLNTYTPYSEYCNTPGAADSGQWCLDHIQKLYDIGTFSKDKFAGVAVDWMEYDDVKYVCDCQAYPVTNTIFDGRDGTPITACAKLT